MININNFQKSTKSSVKHCYSKIFRILQNILRNVFFYFTNLCQRSFLSCPNFFIVTKSPNTVRAPTEMKQNLLYWIDTGFLLILSLKLLNINWDKYSVFHSHGKLDREWTKNTISAHLSRRIKNKLCRATANIQQRKFKF